MTHQLQKDIVRRFGVSSAVAEKMIEKQAAQSRRKAALTKAVRRPVRAADETSFDEDPQAWRQEVQRRMQAIEIMEEGTNELKDLQRLLKRIIEAEQKLIAKKTGSVNKKDEDWWDMQHSGWAMGGREMFAQKLFNILQGLDEAKLAAYIMDKIGFKRSIPIDEDDIAPLIPMDLAPGQAMPGEEPPAEEESIPEDAEGVEAMLVQGAKKQVRAGSWVIDIARPYWGDYDKITNILTKAKIKHSAAPDNFDRLKYVRFPDEAEAEKGYKLLRNYGQKPGWNPMAPQMSAAMAGYPTDREWAKAVQIAYDPATQAKFWDVGGTVWYTGGPGSKAVVNHGPIDEFMEKFKAGKYAKRIKLLDKPKARASIVKADTKADIEKWIKDATQHIEKITTEKAPEKAFLKKTLGFTKGKKYYRVHIMYTSGSGSKSAYCFIDMDGNIYKADNWKRPAKGIRGTIYDVDPNKIDQYTGWLYRR